MVNDLLADELKEIHALSMKTWTPSQWEKKKDTLPQAVIDADDSKQDD